MFEIVILGLCSTQKEIHANIILAGDPKQLDAICKSTIAAKLDFNVSLMERLFKQPLYMTAPGSNKFNAKYITQLVKNYRAILLISSSNFTRRKSFILRWRTRIKSIQ